MITHYLTLRSLAQGFNELLQHATIREVFTQQRNELLISCSAEKGEYTLCVSCDPKLNYIFLRDPVARAKKNSVDLFDRLLSRRINSVSVHPYDRILQLFCDDSSILCYQAFGMMANILLVDEKGVIVDAFKRKKALVETPFEVSRTEEPLKPLADVNGFEAAFRAAEPGNAFAALKTAFPVLGSTLAREILHRSRIDEKTSAKHLTAEDIEGIRKRTEDILAELETPHPTLYYRDDVPRLFSLLPLQHFAGSRAEAFSSVNDAVRSFVVQTYRTQTIDAEKNLLLSKIKGALERTRRLLTAIRDELEHASRAQEHERIATAIMTNLHHLTKGTKIVDLPDPYSAGRSMRVVLDPKLTPAQNAARYFDKAKHARNAYDATERRESAVKRELALLEKLQLHLDSCLTKEHLKEFREEYQKDLIELKLIKPGKSREEIPFRVFTVTGGFQVWAGKSSENNELLTMKHAKPNDLWFHARGGSGSHVVLKVGSSKISPSKQAITEAAGVAAYYSKMRKATMVPVAYCERKYVKKPKGAPAGTVTLMREKTIFVEPALPAGALMEPVKKT
jgi:predicted ribosome quality control (RQC) complex YloA/Tae2 family protein